MNAGTASAGSIRLRAEDPGAVGATADRRIRTSSPEPTLPGGLLAVAAYHPGRYRLVTGDGLDPTARLQKGAR